MQLMQWLPGKCAATESSSAPFRCSAACGPPPSVLPASPTPAWQSTFTPLMPVKHSIWPAISLSNLSIMGVSSASQNNILESIQIAGCKRFHTFLAALADPGHNPSKLYTDALDSGLNLSRNTHRSLLIGCSHR